MKNTLALLLMTILTLSACTPKAGVDPEPPPAAEPVVVIEMATPNAGSPADAEAPDDWKTYMNSAFGLSFQYPGAWFGPDEYISDHTLRVAVGSDVVYPYGTDRTEQIYEINNSYYVIIQYSQNDQNLNLNDTYQLLLNLQDGESFSDARSLLTRVRPLTLGRFEGYEYISTLSESAQTEPFYSRGVLLLDDQSNLLTLMGAPNNVAISNSSGWRAAYQKVDEENLELFHDILESVTIQ